MTHDLGSVSLEILMRNTPSAIAATDATGCLMLFSPALQRPMNHPLKQLAEDEMVSDFALYAADAARVLTRILALARLVQPFERGGNALRPENSKGHPRAGATSASAGID